MPSSVLGALHRLSRTCLDWEPHVLLVCLTLVSSVGPGNSTRVSSCVTWVETKGLTSLNLPSMSLLCPQCTLGFEASKVKSPGSTQFESRATVETEPR